METNTKPSSKKLNGNYCKHCDCIIFGGSFSFKAHLFTHNDIKARFKCKFCCKEYFRIDSFSRHLKSHKNVPGEKKYYVCDQCKRPFVDKRNLIVHLKVHENMVKPGLYRFSCSACDVSYCEQRILDNHIRKTHFNRNECEEPIHFKKLLNDIWFEPVLCLNDCVQMTKINNNVISIKKCAEAKTEILQNHQKQNTDNNKKIKFCRSKTYSDAVCDYCNKVMVKKSLRNHIQEVHLNIRKFNCIKCNKSFSRRYQFYEHNCKYRVNSI